MRHPGAWATAVPETIRLCITPGPEVFDGPDVCFPNPLRDHITTLLRQPNSRRDDLASAVRRRIGEARADAGVLHRDVGQQLAAAVAALSAGTDALYRQ